MRILSFRCFKKLSHGLACIALSLTAWAGTSYADFSDGLVGHYSFNGDGTEVVLEGNAELMEEAGVSGGALKLDGEGSYADLGKIVEFDTNAPFSVSLWIKRDQRRKEIIISKKEKSRTNRGWIIRIGARSELVFSLTHKSHQDRIQVRSMARLVDTNSYYHVVATSDGTGSVEGLKLYVDGKLQEVIRKPGKQSLTGTIQTLAHVNIGARNNMIPGRQKTFMGLVDELMFYDRNLTAEEVKTLYAMFFVSGGGSLPGDTTALKEQVDELLVKVSSLEEDVVSLEANLATLEEGSLSSQALLTETRERLVAVEDNLKNNWRRKIMTYREAGSYNLNYVFNSERRKGMEPGIYDCLLKTSNPAHWEGFRFNLALNHYIGDPVHPHKIYYIQNIHGMTAACTGGIAQFLPENGTFNFSPGSCDEEAYLYCSALH